MRKRFDLQQAARGAFPEPCAAPSRFGLTLRPGSENRRGAVAILVALFLLLLIGFVGLAIDGGRVLTAKQQLQAAADAAALAACQIVENDPLANDPSTPYHTTRQAAVDIAAENDVTLAPVQLDHNYLNALSGQVVVGFWDVADRTFTPDTIAPNAVRSRATWRALLPILATLLGPWPALAGDNRPPADFAQLELSGGFYVGFGLLRLGPDFSPGPLPLGGQAFPSPTNVVTRLLVDEASGAAFGYRLEAEPLRLGWPLIRVDVRPLGAGDQLPTVRQLAVDLSINPNTVVRAYRELEIRGVLETQQGTGTFISHQKIERDEVERQRLLDELVGQFVARAGAAGFSARELVQRIQEQHSDTEKRGE